MPFVPPWRHPLPSEISNRKSEIPFSAISAPLERFKKYCSQFGARIFGFWQGFGEGAGLKNPVTEPKRCQNTKKTASRLFPSEWLQYFLNRSSLAKSALANRSLTNAIVKSPSRLPFCRKPLPNLCISVPPWRDLWLKKWPRFRLPISPFRFPKDGLFHPLFKKNSVLDASPVGPSVENITVSFSSVLKWQ
jgi:hypothetical protein